MIRLPNSETSFHNLGQWKWLTLTLLPMSVARVKLMSSYDILRRPTSGKRYFVFLWDASDCPKFRIWMPFYVVELSDYGDLFWWKPLLLSWTISGYLFCLEKTALGWGCLCSGLIAPAAGHLTIYNQPTLLYLIFHFLCLCSFFSLYTLLGIFFFLSNYIFSLCSVIFIYFKL